MNKVVIWFKTKLLGKKPKRLELRLVPYALADKMMKKEPNVWTIAKEEDSNFIKGFVYIERLSYE